MKKNKDLLEELYKHSFSAYQLVHSLPDDGRIKKLKQTLDKVKKELDKEEN